MISQLYTKVIHWKNKIVVDIFSTLLEAILVLAISSLSLMLWSIQFGLYTEDVGIVEAISRTMRVALHPTDSIIYVTGILSSTTAYFILRLTLIKEYIVRVVMIFIITFATFFLATPLFISGLSDPPTNPRFALVVSIILGIIATAIWTYSLFSQRRIFEQLPIPTNLDDRGIEIAAKVEETYE